MENNEENKIQDAQVISDVATEDAQEEKSADNVLAASNNFKEENFPLKKEPSFKSHLAMIFLLGFLIGIAVKTEALKKVTIGYNDYLMKIKSQSYNINDIQTKLQQQAQEAAQIQGGDTNSGSVPDSTVIPDQGTASSPSGDNNSGSATNQVQN